MPVENLNSESKDNIIHPLPVPKSKICNSLLILPFNFFRSNSIINSVSGLGISTLLSIIYSCFQKFLLPIIYAIGSNFNLRSTRCIYFK